MKRILLISLLGIITLPSVSQSNNLQGWHLKDIKTDGFPGISLNAAYQFLIEKQIKSTQVIVAVLDDGIDTAHEDLRAVLWTNQGEIPGNHIDDDHNGYIDDIHGWNFLGNPDGRNVNSISSEWIRVYWRYKQQFFGKNIDSSKMNADEKYAYRSWLKARSGVEGKGLKEEELENLKTFYSNALFCDSLLKNNFHEKKYTQTDLKAYSPANAQENKLKEYMLEVFKQSRDADIYSNVLINEIDKYVTGEIRRSSGDKVPPENNRGDITGDDETNFSNTHYGNNQLLVKGLVHGTHVSGIIGAVRNNGIGMDGIADNVKIMLIRVSADGDEYDKDIALGIRYAADNGAKVINMSLGKSLSPDKKEIDAAVRYALAKDVLLVQAAGNSKRNIDGYDNYPNPLFLNSDSLAPNWIMVGASDTLGRAADFSNYGAHAVDIFAPGVAIYSTIPDVNNYAAYDGTSMASPVVAGTAALLRSYFPKLTAIEIKKILEQSAYIPNAKGLQPGTSNEVPLKMLCKTGGIVNAFNAVKMAYAHNK